MRPMRSKSEIKTTKHIACEQNNCLNAYAHIDIKKFQALYFFKCRLMSKLTI